MSRVAQKHDVAAPVHRGLRTSASGWRRPAVCAAAACLLLTACGSTVQEVSGPGAASAGAPGALLADGVSQGLEAPTTSSQSGSALNDSQPGSALGDPAGDSAVGSGTAGATGSGSVGGGAVSGPKGSTTGAGTATTSSAGALVPATFKIGLQYSSNGGAALKSVGGTSFDQDQRKDTDAVIAWINKNGGVAGRKVEPSYNDIDATASPTAQSQSACAQWAEDDRVAVAIPKSSVDDRDLLRECLKKFGVPALLANTFSRTPQSSFSSSPLWFENIPLSLDAYARTYVQGLAKQGFFKGGKVGVVYYDRVPFTTVLKSALLPALREVGVADPETFGASIDGGSSLSSGSSEMSSAVLAFRSAGVDRVLFFEPWIGYFAFLNQARSQNYFPAYGLTSQQGAQGAMDLGLIQADQLKDARLVSWFPMNDVRDYKSYLGPRLKLCTQIYKEAGVPPPADQISYAAQLYLCEALLLVKDAYRTAPRQLAPQDFTRGMEALGSSLQFATRPGGAFSPSKHWASSKYWAGRFDSSRETFVLEGPPQNVS
jgi:hypothetical protein